MMRYEVFIKEFEDAFRNAHKTIIVPKSKSRVHGRQLWKKFFNVDVTFIPQNEDDIIKNDGIWVTLIFPSKEHYMLFLLEWK